MSTDCGKREAAEHVEEVARILLDQGAVAINVAQPFIYTSGIKSPIYCDLRLLTGSPETRDRITDLLVERVRATCDIRTLDVVAGVATAGISWAAWVAKSLNKPMAYVRDAPKGHGKGHQVEGGVSHSQSAIVLEDLTSAGGSAINAVNGLRDLGAKADYCFSIFTYESPQSEDNFRRAGVQLYSLCGISTLLEVATSKRQITAEDECAVREWLQNGPLASRGDKN